MFFESWSSLLRVLVVGTLAYVSLVALLRVSGKRTLAKPNAFDLAVTVGSALATVLLTGSIALPDVIAALALLVGLQYVVAFVAVRWPLLDAPVKSQSTLLLHLGLFLNRGMRAHRETREEVVSVQRPAGLVSAEDPAAVVIETNGTLSFLRASSVPAGEPIEVPAGVPRATGSGE